MQVLLTYTSYPLTPEDWRGRFIFDLAQALSERTELRMWGPPGPIPPRAKYIAPSADAEWFSALLHAGGIAHLLRRRRIRGITTGLQLLHKAHRAHRRNKDVDVAHVNWLQNALALYGTRTPALVGVLGSDFKLLDVPGMTALLRLALRQRRCVIAPNGKWMEQPLRERFGDIARVQYVPFGVDRRWFLIDRVVAPDRPRRWLVVVRVTAKKLGPLFEWGSALFRGADELHLLGPKQEDIQIPEWVRYHGPTNPDALAREWYPNAAGVISLSAHDEGRPQVLLEAMAAGLPVLASPIPAHCDIVHHRENGWIVHDADGLREGIQALSDPTANLTFGARGRDWIRQNVGTWDDTAERYMRLYRELCGP